MYSGVSRYPAVAAEVHDLQSIGKIVQGELVHSLVGCAALGQYDSNTSCTLKQITKLLKLARPHMQGRAC